MADSKTISAKEYEEQAYSLEDVENAMAGASRDLKRKHSIDQQDLELFKGRVRKLLRK